MNELKPCPFCGGDAEVMYAQTDDGTKTISVVCQMCNTGIFRARMKPNEWNAWYKPEQAIEAWNTRADDQTGKWLIYEVANTEEEQPIAWECDACGAVVDCKTRFCPECGQEKEV